MAASTVRRPATSGCKTSADPSGKRILGTLNNCAGGMTPWGTYLTAEENFHVYFWTDQRDADDKPVAGLGGDQAESYARYGVPASWQAWGKFHDRFNVDKEPNEPNRFGWIVEIDPFDPHFVPVKHTALGRFCHEGAETRAQQGRPRRRLLRRRHARRICLSLRHRRHATTRTTAPPICRSCRRARCRRADSTPTAQATWLPLVFGEQWLTPEFGFKSRPMC